MLAAITAVLIVASPSSFAALSRLDSGGKVRVRIAGANNGQDVRNGGVSGKGQFTATGAIADKGTVVAYRTVKGNLDTGNAVTFNGKDTRFMSTGLLNPPSIGAKFSAKFVPDNGTYLELK